MRCCLAAVLLVLFPGAARAAYVFDAFPALSSFAAPMGIVDPGDGTDRLFVIQRGGQIYVFTNDPTVSTRTLFLDISAQITTQTEGGLLGMAFHPDHAGNGHFYVTFTTENPRREVLARFSVDPSNPDAALPASQLAVLEIPKTNLHHNGGQIAFGSDGYLYWSVGEDGIAHYAQDLTQWNGKLLRIDVDSPSGGSEYGIPADNPFVGAGGGVREEIWAFGFRNPWRFSFDPPTERLWLGDVGQDSWEEIDIVLKGRNYGWPRMEGNECFSPSVCDTAGLNVVAPLFVYPHSGSASITGGFVYRGPSMPSLAGKYIYADYITDAVWALSWDGVNPPVNSFLTTLANVPSFGTDRDGELFIASFDGNIYRLFDSATPVSTEQPPSELRIGPNPFEAGTTISYSLKSPSRVRVDVFDVKGSRVSTLLDRNVAAGAGSVSWTGRDSRGNRLRSGVYFVRFSVNDRALETHRVTLLQ